MTDFEQIYSGNYSFILKYLIKLCKDPPLAEELAQETFFRAYMNLAQLRDPGTVPGWLCQIAKNSFYAWLRENQKTAELDEALEDPGPDVAEAMVRKDLSQKAFAAVHELEEPYKEVFLLNVFANLSLSEISALFGKSESWARVTLFRAKKKLKEKLEEKR